MWSPCHWFIIAVVQSLTLVWVFTTPWTAAHQVSLSFISPGVCSNSCPLSQWYYPTVSFSVVAFSCPQSSPGSGSFPASRLFTSGGQSIGASASVLPVNIQGWFPLAFTSLISLQFIIGECQFALATLLGARTKKIWSLVGKMDDQTSNYDNERLWPTICRKVWDHIVTKLISIIVSPLERRTEMDEWMARWKNE